MSAVDADADAAGARGPAAPVARLAGILVLLGLAGVVTAGGISALAARMQASISGSEVDGLSMLLPGLVVTAVMASLAAASTARVVRGARRVPPLALARHASALAIRPLAVTAVLVGVVCESRLPGGLAEVA
uniref:hypothetical protein n=1 Tax=Clavibacter sp. MX14-G9D TaxID=3064656 RepID=UPI00293F0D48